MVSRYMHDAVEVGNTLSIKPPAVEFISMVMVQTAWC